jgi:transcriptional regulator GlxA family with amidase domain
VQRLKPEYELLLQLSRRAKIMASACSGGVLLANAGLLSGRRATICWWLVDWFRQQFPDINLVPDRLVVRDRDRWTAAAGSAYMHLGLELVREFAGPQVASATARLMLVERRRGSQSPFIAPPAPAQSDADADISRALRYIDQHATGPLTIAKLCRAISVNERTLARKFRVAVGMPPLSYLQSKRMARARQLLEDSSLPLERIVEQCGYEDISSFRKLFSRHVGMTPREYRSRFGG